MAKQFNFNGYLIKEYGAYIRTNISNLLDINGVASGIIGVVGLSERGEDGVPVTINSYTELVNTFGDGPMVRAALAMYVGGAQTLVCVRVGSPTRASLSATQVGASTAKTYTFAALEKGTFGNNVSVSVSTIDSKSNTPNPLPANVADNLINDDFFNVAIRYSDSRGNDIRESFVFPKYIPTALDSKGLPRFYTDNGTGVLPAMYYVLRDRENGYVRDLPNVWSFGLTNAQSFINRVDDLKSSTEDLITFPVYTGTGAAQTRNLFPLALVQQIVNGGSFGFAPSQFVVVKDVEPGITDLLTVVEGDTLWTQAVAETLIEHAFVPLSGGTNGDDGTGFYSTTGDVTFSANPDSLKAWDIGLAALEEEDINFVQPGYMFNGLANNKAGTTWTQRYGFFQSIAVKFLRHVKNQSNTKTRKFRTSILGVPYYKSTENSAKDAGDYLTAIKDVSGTLNDDRIQLWAGGFKSRAFSNRAENYGADMLANFAAGLHASRNPEDSLTFLPISGIFTDGLEFNFTSGQREELYSRSLAHVVRRRNSAGAIEFVAAHNMTSWTGSANRGLQLFITRRIVDYMNTFVYRNLEDNFIGNKSNGAATSANLGAYTTTLLKRLVSEGKLVAFANVVATTVDGDPTAFDIRYKFQPVSEIDFIFITNELTYSLT